VNLAYGASNYKGTKLLSSVDFSTATFYILVLVFFFISIQPRSSSAIYAFPD